MLRRVGVGWLRAHGRRPCWVAADPGGGPRRRRRGGFCWRRWRRAWPGPVGHALDRQGHRDRRFGPRPHASWPRVAAPPGLAARRGPCRGVLVTVSLGSHAAALLESSAAATSADVLHLLSAAVWVGGLAPLLVSLVHARRTLDGAPRRRLLGELVARFSTIATISVGAVVITGAFATWIQVVELPRLVRTDYGWALVAKLVLVAPLLGLGGANLLWTRRRLGDTRPTAATRWAPRLVAGRGVAWSRRRCSGRTAHQPRARAPGRAR